MPKSMNPLAIATLDTPIGPLRVAAHSGGLARVLFDTQKDEVLEEDPNPSDEAKQHLEAALQALREYFANERQSFEDLTLAPVGTDFQLSVWQALLNIGYGDTCAYRDIATSIGNPKAVRAVGLANGKNPIPVIVPCHRVVGANGTLTGFGGGLPAKKWLLEHEGALAGSLI
jgi:methylated-DNA-[protein]-cysteine S-methyltransferase|tara:strand:+ start:476 stop:991 length:516 start_codon:yes stop_codon:yes gene_type:complete